MQVLNTGADSITITWNGKEHTVNGQSYIALDGGGPIVLNGVTYGAEGGAFGTNSIVFTNGTGGLAGASPQ